MQVVHPSRQFLIAQFLDLRTGQHQAALGQQADLPGDGLGGILVVASHHDAPEPGPPRHVHRLHHFRPRRVDHAEESDKGEILLDIFETQAIRYLRQRPIRYSQHPQCVARHVTVLLEHLLASLLRQRDGLPGLLDVGAVIQDDIGRPLHEGDELRIGEAHHGSLPL